MPSHWVQQASQVSPLLGFTAGSWGGETGVIEKIFSILPASAHYAVEFGQKAIGSGTLARFVARHAWSVLYFDRDAPDLLTSKEVAGRRLTLAREVVSPANINDLFAKHGVPKDFDCLVIDIDGQDLWVWEAIDLSYRPALVIIEFNAHVGFGVKATIQADAAWVYRRSKDYGGSFAAMVALAENKGYRLVHVHGPWNLYFIRDDLAFPTELSVRLPLAEADLALLTDTQAFYDACCGEGKRPSWFEAPAPHVSRVPWELLAPVLPSKQVQVADMSIEVADKYDVTWYGQRKIFEEKASMLYRFVAHEGYVNFVDIGANVGLVSILARRASPSLNVVAVEADPRLARLIRRNFQQHGLEGAHVVNAIVGQYDLDSKSFSLNPSSTLDNRVHVDKWPKIRVPMVRMDGLLKSLSVTGKTFFKIDTQGFEEHVLQGLEPWLMNTDDWVLKMEFAPDWLRSQGTDPAALLDYLQLRYEFVEFPERIAFGTAGFNALFAAPISYRQQSAFLDHVVSLNRGGTGWVDLLVRPRHA